MAVNVKLGNNTISGVNSINVEDADNEGTYIGFSTSGGYGNPYRLIAVSNVKGTFTLQEEV